MRWPRRLAGMDGVEVGKRKREREKLIEGCLVREKECQKVPSLNKFLR